MADPLENVVQLDDQETLGLGDSKESEMSHTRCLPSASGQLTSTRDEGEKVENAMHRAIKPKDISFRDMP